MTLEKMSAVFRRRLGPAHQGTNNREVDVKCLRIASTVCFVILMIGSAAADQVYSSRADFINALDSVTYVDFEDQSTGPVVGDPWLGLGIVFDEAGVGNNMAIGSGGGVDMNIYAQGGESADIDVSFPDQGTQACGIAVFSNSVQTAPGERLVFYGEGDAVLADVPMPVTAPGTSEFVGYTADVAIVRVAFIENNADGDYVGIGEVIFGEWSLNPVDRITWTRIKRLYSE
jgi:hypothetical protein